LKQFGRSARSPEFILRAAPSGTSLCEELELQGFLCNLSATPENSSYAHFRLARTPRTLLQSHHHGRRRARIFFRLGLFGLFLARYCSNLFFFFFQQNSNNFRKWQKNPKIVKPIFLGSLFSLEFNKNSFVIFSGNKKF
jgi:hypothetical protein